MAGGQSEQLPTQVLPNGRRAALLPANQDFESTEGNLKKRWTTVRERNPKARQACIDYWGYKCVVCGMSFGEKYGDLGEGFIHVHHLLPIADSDGERQVDPVEELRPVCPNCHAMLHRKRPPLTHPGPDDFE